MAKKESATPSKAVENPEKFVKSAIKSNKVVCFIGLNDSFSLRALSALRRSGVKKSSLSVVCLSELDVEEEVRDILLGLTDGRSVPRVFITGKFVGGASDVEYLEMTGELQELLRAAKAYKKQKPL